MCSFFELNCDQDMCLSLVSVVSSPVVASCESACCVEEQCEREKGVICNFSVHSDQCLQPSENPFVDGSINLRRKEQLKMAAGSWQEWRGWRTSGSSYE